MRYNVTAFGLFGALLCWNSCLGQDLTPRAYVITPAHTNAVLVCFLIL